MSTAAIAATAALIVLASVSGDAMAIIVAALVVLAIVDTICDLIGGR